MFELYHSLESQAKAPGKIDTASLREKISRLDLEGHTFIYALIYYHYITVLNAAPPQLSDKVSLDLSSYDDTLLGILNRFAQMHQQRMKEKAEMQRAAKIFQSQ